MKQYSRVSYVERCQIFAFLQANISIPEIAKRLGFHKTTIYRELKRNHTPRGSHGNYWHETAERMSMQRRQSQRRKSHFTKPIVKQLKLKLQAGWSPEQIANRSKLEGVYFPSHTSTYRYLADHPELKVYLRKRRKRGCGRYRQRKATDKPWKIPLHKRPKVANERRRFGDWERDTMYCKNAKQLLVCVDRKSRLTKFAAVEERTCAEIGKLTVKLIKQTGRRYFSITNDNGNDFKANVDLGVPVYFTEPRKPHQRGTVENTIGLLRQYISTKTDLNEITNKQLRKLEDSINLRPRKILGYKTPYEVYFNKKVALAM